MTASSYAAPVYTLRRLYKAVHYGRRALERTQAENMSLFCEGGLPLNFANARRRVSGFSQGMKRFKLKASIDPNVDWSAKVKS